MSTLIPRAALSAAALGATLTMLLPTVADARRAPEALQPPKQSEILIFGHRGASGYRPEHTLASYALAARMGADVIEPDLVSTKDGVLVARHENEISGTTDVADHPEFADRKATKTIDGVAATGWFTEDFTLAELKTLRAKERLPAVRQRNTLYDGRFRIPTFQEVLDLRAKLQVELHRPIGVAPETKHPTYFRSIGKGLEEPLIITLRLNRLDRKRSGIYVQSFEVSNLRFLNKVLKVNLVQLSSASGSPYDTIANGSGPTYDEMETPAGLAQIAEYADVAGPDKTQIVPRDADARSLPATSFVTDAHAAGLKVVPYTFRDENQFLPLELRVGTDPVQYGNAFGEFQQFFDLGVDGLFTDNTDTAVEARAGLDA